MNLSYLIAELQSKIEEIGHYKTYILRDKESKHSDDYEEIPIKDVIVDKEGQEINLISNQNKEQSNKKLSTLILKEFYKKIEAFMPDCADYELYETQPEIEVDEYWFRLDVPIIAYGIDDDDECIGLITENKS